MPVKDKTVEKEITYNPVSLIEWNHMARMYGFSLDHPYTITVRKGQGFIRGVERNPVVSRKGNAIPVKPGKKIEIEEGLRTYGR